MTSKTISKLLWFLLIVVGLTAFLFATLSLGRMIWPVVISSITPN